MSFEDLVRFTCDHCGRSVVEGYDKVKYFSDDKAPAGWIVFRARGGVADTKGVWLCDDKERGRGLACSPNCAAGLMSTFGVRFLKEGDEGGGEPKFSGVTLTAQREAQRELKIVIHVTSTKCTIDPRRISEPGSDTLVLEMHYGADAGQPGVYRHTCYFYGDEDQISYKHVVLLCGREVLATSDVLDERSKE